MNENSGEKIGSGETSDEATGWEGVAELAGKMNEQQREASTDDTVEHYTEEMRKYNNRYNELNDAIPNSSNADRKRLEAEQDEAYQKAQEAKEQLDRLKGASRPDGPSEKAPEQPSAKKVVTGADLMKTFLENRRDFESYASEMAGKSLEEIAPHFNDDNAFLEQAIMNLSGGEENTRTPAEISSDEIVQYYTDDIKKYNQRFNELNGLIAQKQEQIGLFGRLFGVGKAAKEKKALESEQNDMYNSAQAARGRLDRLNKMLSNKN